MEKRATSNYVWLGTLLRYLHDVQIGFPIQGEGHVLANLAGLREELQKLSFPVSERALAWSHLDSFQEELEAAEKDAVVTQEQADRLQRAMSHVWTTVLAESSGTYAFVVSEKRVPVDKLLDAPADLFAPGVYSRLPRSAQVDFADAGRCIAYEAPTAAAFHLMRGTESVLRDYYLSVVKQKRVNPLLWGPMVTHLRKRKSNPPPAALLDHLDSIRINFRNPTQHPDAVYDIHEAQTLWGLSVDVVDRATRAKPCSDDLD